MSQQRKSKPSAFGPSTVRSAAADDGSSTSDVTTVKQSGAADDIEAHPFSPALVRRMAAMPPTLPKDAVVTPFGTRLPPEMQRMVKIACSERGIRMQDATYEAFWSWLHRT